MSGTSLQGVLSYIFFSQKEKSRVIPDISEGNSECYTSLNASLLEVWVPQRSETPNIISFWDVTRCSLVEKIV
jgi:hypothetical protein